MNNVLLAQGTYSGGFSGGTNSGNNDCCDKVKEGFGWPWWWECNERRESVVTSKTCKEDRYEYFDTKKICRRHCNRMGNIREWSSYIKLWKD